MPSSPFPYMIIITRLTTEGSDGVIATPPQFKGFATLFAILFDWWPMLEMLSMFIFTGLIFFET
jgi:hypothetical protein